MLPEYGTPLCLEHFMIRTVISARPITLPAPGRGADLGVRVSAPADGDDLPVIVFSHGARSSMDAYAPLVDHWTAEGFAVIQPTHLDSPSLNVNPGDPRYDDIWRFRVEDLSRIVDRLDLLAGAVPGLAGRLDTGRIAVAGHSWGATTASMLLGARVLDADGGPGKDMTDPRITAGVLFALAGTGFADLSPFAAENFPFMNPGFGGMSAPALIVAGDQDQSLLTVRGPEWFTDGYRLSPGPKSLVTLAGAEHMLGGIHAYGAGTPDESPERVEALRRLSVAYLRSAFDPADTAWANASTELPAAMGRVESR
jgi:dienelactone hydrolase